MSGTSLSVSGPGARRGTAHTVIALVLPAAAMRPALAQTADSSATKPRRGLAGLLQKVDRAICGKDGAACAASAATSPGGADAAGRSLRILRQGLDPAAEPTAPAARPDTGVVRTLARTACGTSRLCVPGWDLRIVSVALPDSVLPAGARVPVTTVLENRGRETSAPSEVRLCWGGAGTCDTPLELLPVRALASGERIQLTYPASTATLPPTGGPWTAVALVDPDRATAEANRANNSGASRPFRDEHAALQFLAFDVPAAVRAGSRIPVTLRVRNKSAFAPSPATEVQLRGWQSVGCVEWGDGATRLQVPALGPRQVWAAQVEVTDPKATRKDCANWQGQWFFVGAFDPDHRQTWGAGHEAEEIVRNYQVSAGGQ